LNFGCARIIEWCSFFSSIFRYKITVIASRFYNKQFHAVQGFPEPVCPPGSNPLLIMSCYENWMFIAAATSLEILAFGIHDATSRPHQVAKSSFASD